MRFVESQKIKNSFAFNVDIFSGIWKNKKYLHYPDISAKMKNNKICYMEKWAAEVHFFYCIGRERSLHV